MFEGDKITREKIEWMRKFIITQAHLYANLTGAICIRQTPVFLTQTPELEYK